MNEKQHTIIFLPNKKNISYRTVIYCRLVHSLLYQNSLLLCWIPKTARLRRDLLNTGLVHASKAVKIFLRRLHLVPASLVTDAGTAAELTIFLSELQTAPYPRVAARPRARTLNWCTRRYFFVVHVLFEWRQLMGRQRSWASCGRLHIPEWLTG